MDLSIESIVADKIAKCGLSVYLSIDTHAHTHREGHCSLRMLSTSPGAFHTFNYLNFV